jgi:hypothetical protein
MADFKPGDLIECTRLRTEGNRVLATPALGVVIKVIDDPPSSRVYCHWRRENGEWSNGGTYRGLMSAAPKLYAGDDADEIYASFTRAALLDVWVD